MMFQLRPQAEADLERILLHIAGENPSAAQRWLDTMLACCQSLGTFPHIGVARPDIRPDLRMLPCGHYLVLYRATDDGAEIVRVLHGAQDWQKFLKHE